MKLDRDTWLSDVMGWEVQRINLSTEDTNSNINSLNSEFQALALGIPRSKNILLFAKLASDQLDLVNWLIDLGFYVVEEAITLTRQQGHKVSMANNHLATVRDMGVKDSDSVISIAKNSFRYSRFHVDPLIPLSIANQIKGQWMRSYIEGTRGNSVLIGLLEDKPAGFLAILDDVIGRESCLTIDLIAVDPEHQRHGVAQTMIQSLVLRAEHENKVIKVGTQAANTASLELYKSCGFEIFKTEYVLHHHFGNNASQIEQ